MMKPSIQDVTDIKLIGMRLTHSRSDDKTVILWKKFMPRKKEIKNLENNWHYAVQSYSTELKIENFTPNTMFEIWAAVEVSDFEIIPKEMESLTIKGGKYAVFIHKGDANAFAKTMNFIFGVWLPNSEYELGKGEHFAVMKEKYLGENNPNSEEEVWVSIK